MVVAPTTRLPPWVSAPSVPVAENTSCEDAPPLRAKVSVAPLKLSGGGEFGIADRDIGVEHHGRAAFGEADGAPSKPREGRRVIDRADRDGGGARGRECTARALRPGIAVTEGPVDLRSGWRRIAAVRIGDLLQSRS